LSLFLANASIGHKNDDPTATTLLNVEGEPVTIPLRPAGSGPRDIRN
jgi:hypothetical protein